MRDFADGFSRMGGDFEIFRKTTRVTPPSESTLNNPSFGNDCPTRFDFFRNIDT